LNTGRIYTNVLVFQEGRISMIEYPLSETMPRSHLPFSPVTRVGNLLFVSGQASVDDAGRIVSDTFEGEVRRSIENMKRILEGAGSSLQHVVQTRNYVRDEADLARYNELYREIFSEPFPARMTLTQCLPATLKYEIECIAVVAE
jgi:2-iminobutanoate/2-iminopropanoate deaminase